MVPQTQSSKSIMLPPSQEVVRDCVLLLNLYLPLLEQMGLDTHPLQPLKPRPTRPLPTRRQPSGQSTKMTEPGHHHVSRLERSFSDLQLDQSSSLSKRGREDLQVYLFPSNKILTHSHNV